MTSFELTEGGIDGETQEKLRAEIVDFMNRRSETLAASPPLDVQAILADLRAGKTDGMEARLDAALPERKRIPFDPTGLAEADLAMYQAVVKERATTPEQFAAWKTAALASGNPARELLANVLSNEAMGVFQKI